MYIHVHNFSKYNKLKFLLLFLQDVPSGLATMTTLEELQLYGNNLSSEKLGTQTINMNAVGRLAVHELQSRLKEL